MLVNSIYIFILEKKSVAIEKLEKPIEGEKSLDVDSIRFDHESVQEE